MSRYIAIDVDAAGLFIVAGSARGNAVRVEQALPILDDPRPLTPDTAAEWAKRLKEALAVARVPAAPVLVCVGRDRVVMKEVRHPKTAPNEEPAVVRFQAQRDLAEAPDTLHLDYVPLPSPAGAEDKRAAVVFVRKELFNAARTMCESAGLKLAGFTPRSYATAASVRRAVAAGAVTPPENASAPIGVLSLWDGGGEFVVYHGEHLVFSRSVSAMALQSESALVGEAKRSLAAFSAQSPRERLDALYLSEGHDGGSWAARLQDSLPVPVIPFDPLVGHPAADAVPSHLRGRFTAAVGLLAARGHGPLPINFVTPRQPRAEPSKGRSWVLIGLLLVILLGAGIGGGMYFLYSGLDNRMTKAKAKKKNADDEIKIEEKAVNKVKAIEEYQKKNVNWLDLMYDFAAAHPDVSKVRVKEFDGKLKQPVAVAKPGPAPTLPPGGKVATAGGAKPGANTPLPAKVNAQAEPVAELRLDLVSASEDSDTLVRRLVEDLFVSEKSHFSKADLDWSSAASGRRQATVKVDLLPRKSSDYIRKLIAEFPKQPPPQPQVQDPLPFNFDEGDMQ